MNGPLKIESDDPTPAPVQSFKIRFLEFLANTHSRHAIGHKVHELERQYKQTLGQYADFWLLLAIGAEIADPYHVYGTVVSRYRGEAKACNDFSQETLIRHTVLTRECHQQRETFSSGQINPDLKYRYRVAAAQAMLRLEKLDPGFVVN